jgi:hypothetical protein
MRCRRSLPLSLSLAGPRSWRRLPPPDRRNGPGRGAHGRGSRGGGSRVPVSAVPRRGPGGTYARLRSQGREDLIVAGLLAVKENDLDSTTSSLGRP